MSDTIRTDSPHDEVLLAALRRLRLTEPGLGAPKILARLKEEHATWILSEKRLKKLMNGAGLGTHKDPSVIVERPGIKEEAHALKLQPLQPFVLGNHLGPFKWAKLDGTTGHVRDVRRMKRGMSEALLHQLDYAHNSDRSYRLYGRGDYDWGVTINADRNLHLSMCVDKLTTEGTVRPVDIFALYLMLLRAARNAGVPAADLRSQLHAEYGKDPLLAAGPPMTKEEGRETQERDQAAYKQNLLQLHQALHEDQDIPDAIKARFLTNTNGQTVWIEEKMGMNAVFSVPVSKKDENWRLTEELKQHYAEQNAEFGM